MKANYDIALGRRFFGENDEVFIPGAGRPFLLGVGFSCHPGPDDDGSIHP